MDEEVLRAAATADGGGNDNRDRADGCGEGSIGQSDGNTINNQEETHDGIAVKRSARQSSTQRGNIAKGRKVLPDSPLIGFVKKGENISYRTPMLDEHGDTVRDTKGLVRYHLVKKETQEVKANFMTYLRELADVPTCVDAHGNVLQCKCLRLLRSSSDSVLDAVSTSLFNYGELSGKSKKVFQMERSQYACALSSSNWNNKKGAERKYVLPVAILSDDGPASNELKEAFQYRICTTAWCNLHNIGRREYQKLKGNFNKMSIPKHGNSGNKHRQQHFLNKKNASYGDNGLVTRFSDCATPR